MKKLILILVLVPVLAFAVKPEKKKERDSKKDYMTAKAAWMANPNPAKYRKMMEARATMSTDVIKWRKDRKKK